MNCSTPYLTPILSAALLLAALLFVGCGPVGGNNAAPVAPVDVPAAFAGHLVSMKDGNLTPHDAVLLAGKKYYAIYFSAHWCGPCRAFTPKLVAAYNDLKAQHPDRFEVIFYSADRSAKDMAGYIEGADMPWPAVAYDQRDATGLARYAGSGIPCLTVIDSDGQIVVDGRQTFAPQALEQFKQVLAAGATH